MHLEYREAENDQKNIDEYNDCNGLTRVLLDINNHRLVHLNEGIKIDADIDNQRQEKGDANEQRNKFTPIEFLVIILLVFLVLLMTSFKAC